jgi:hypothetical protein
VRASAVIPISKFGDERCTASQPAIPDNDGGELDRDSEVTGKLGARPGEEYIGSGAEWE